MDDPTGPGQGPSETDEMLRAKYYDYCSARVADVLLGMTPDQIFIAAEEAAKGRGISGELTYERMVGLATEHVSRNLNLPSFEDWSRRYTADPQAIDAELLGLWKTEPDPGE